MTDTANTFTTLAVDPGLAEAFWPEKERIWPGFMFEDRYSNMYWSHLSRHFPEWQHYLLDDSGAPIAVAQTIPCVWDGTMQGLPVGWAEGLVQGAEGYLRGDEPNTLMALEIAISPDHTGQGISYTMLNAIRVHAREAGFQALIVAVRPSLKSHYPITPMERYCRWQRDDGLPFDH
ncbi:MAG: GNAT family N-acetyltransferase, partial [Chloroflexota bacterium]